MADVWQMPVERTGDRLTVYASTWSDPGLYVIHKNKVIVLTKLQEARVLAEKFGHDDGIWVVFRSLRKTKARFKKKGKVLK
jgi:hypothetical protein